MRQPPTLEGLSTSSHDVRQGQAIDWGSCNGSLGGREPRLRAIRWIEVGSKSLFELVIGAPGKGARVEQLPGKPG